LVSNVLSDNQSENSCLQTGALYIEQCDISSRVVVKSGQWNS